MRKIILISLFISGVFSVSAFAAVDSAQLNASLQRAAAQATQKPSVKRCIWCNRLQTPERTDSVCPADVDVHCYFVEDNSNPRRSQQEPDEMASPAKPDTPAQPVALIAFDKNGKTERRCAGCGQKETPENTNDRCTADPDTYCMFYEEEIQEKDHPLTQKELDNAEKLTEALRTLHVIDDKVTTEQVALAWRAVKKQTSFEFFDPFLEIQAEMAWQYVQDHTQDKKQAKSIGSTKEILQIIVFLNDIEL